MKKSPLKLKQCKICERLFYAPRKSTVKYCSDECRELASKRMHRAYEKGEKSVIKLCRFCNTPFVQNDPKRKRQYCSEKCAMKGRRRAQRKHDRRKHKWKEYQKPRTNWMYSEGGLR